MGIFTKDIKSMEDLLIHGLQDIYYAEQQIVKSLPKMIEKATNRDLIGGLKGHLEETNKQIERLQKVFERLGKQPSGTQCPAIDGIIKEADETAGEIEDKAVLDAAIIANAQAVEHYEMCRYGTLIAWAEQLGHDEIVRFLTTNLNEEKAANTKLNNGGAAQGRQREGFERGLIVLSSTVAASRHRGAALSKVRILRTERIFRRRYQAATETISQASDAPMNAVAMLLSTIHQKTIAKASMPSAPSAAPAASSAAASLSASRAVEARLPFATDFMLLDQGGAGAKDGWKGQKQTADGCAITAADEPGEDCRGAAEREADQVFVPTAFPQR